MDPNDYKTIEAFVRSFEKVDGLVKKINPDIVIAPMVGAVPFIDVLNIIDGEFPNDKVEYVPASNKVHKVSDVLRGAFENLIREKVPEGGKLLSLDEVVSGNSVQRVYRQFDAARTNYANKRTVETYGEHTDFRDERVRAFRDSVRESIKYQSVGIVDSRMERAGKNMAEDYLTLVKNKIILPVKTDCIVTMDRADFFPATYKTAEDDQGKKIFLPVIDKFDISPKYVDFLITVAEILGKDRNMVTVKNMGKIRDSYRFVPESLREYHK